MFSKTTEYSIRAIIYLALNNNSKLIGVSEMASELRFPEAFLGKVLQLLVKKQLVGSIKGPGGGFYLIDSTLNLTILNIVDSLEGLEFLDKCGLGLHSCNKNNPCPIHDEYKNVSINVKKALSAKSINEIKNEIENGKRPQSFHF